MFLLTIDLVLTFRGAGLVRSRRAALVLLGFLVIGNLRAKAMMGLESAISAAMVLLVTARAVNVLGT